MTPVCQTCGQSIFSHGRFPSVYCKDAAPQGPDLPVKDASKPFGAVLHLRSLLP